MIIPVDNEHRISSDRHQWIIQERKIVQSGNNKGKERWEAMAYYATLQGAVNGLVQLKLRLANTETLADALDYMETLSNKLTRALTMDYEVDFPVFRLQKRNIPTDTIQ